MNVYLPQENINLINIALTARSIKILTQIHPQLMSRDKNILVFDMVKNKCKEWLKKHFF